MKIFDPNSEEHIELLRLSRTAGLEYQKANSSEAGSTGSAGVQSLPNLKPGGPQQEKLGWSSLEEALAQVEKFAKAK